MSTLGARIREKRESAGLSQTDTAERLGFRSGKQTISRWELDKVEPSISDLKRFAALVGTTAAYLMDGMEKEAIPHDYTLIKKDELLTMQEQLISFMRKESTEKASNST